jgi:Spy/CpxP family protein refolding chaperone
MNKSLRWKLILAFVLVFLAGAACGFFGAMHRVHWIVRHEHPGSLAEHLKRHLQWELRLTPQQVQQVSPIIDRAASQLEAKRDQTMRDVHEIFEQAHQEVQPVLSPEQRTRLEQMEKRHRHLLHQHGFMAPGQPPPPPPPGD